MSIDAHDDDSVEAVEVRKFVLLLLLLTAMLLSAWGSLQELRYRLWGRTVDATITRMKQMPGFGSDGIDVLRIDCSFLDDNIQRSEQFEMPALHPLPVGTIRLEYIPDVKGAFRLEGTNNLWVVAIFAAGAIAFSGFVLLMYLNAHWGTYWMIK